MSIVLSAQSSTDLIKGNDLDIPFLESVIKEEVDHFRRSNNLKTLANDKILYNAALDHAEFLNRAGGMSSKQDDVMKATPELRVAYFGGKEYQVMEVIGQTYWGKEIKKKGQKKRTNTTYKEVAQHLVQNWLQSKKNSKVLTDKDWRITGCAVTVDYSKKLVKVVQVFAWVEWKYNYQEDKSFFKYSNYEPEPIINSFSELPKELIAKKFDYKLRPPKKPRKQCEQCIGISEEVISDSVPFRLKWKGNSIRVYTKNLDLVYNLFDDRRDGLAIEIVEYLPYDCGNNDFYTTPSRRNGQHIFNGVVQKPMYRRQLFKKWRQEERRFNMKKRQKAAKILTEFRDGGDWLKKPQDIRQTLNEQWEPKVLNTKVGKHPRNPNAYYEINLLVIQKNKVCKVIHFPSVCGETINESKDIPYVTNFSEQSYHIDTTQMALRFTIPFEKGKSEYNYEDVKPLLDSVALEDFIVKDAVIRAYSSVEGKTSINEALQLERAQSIINAVASKQKESIPALIEAKEDWDMFYEQIEGLPEYKPWKKKSRQEIKALLKDPKHQMALEGVLDKQRRAEVEFKIYYQYTNETYGRYLMKLFHMHIDSSFKDRTIRLDHRDHAEALQGKMFRAVQEGKMDKKWLLMLQIPSKRLFARMINNQLWIQNEYTPEAYKSKEWEEDLYRTIKKVGNLKRMDPDVVYNYLNFLIKHWRGMKLFDRSMPPKKIWKQINYLRELGYNGRQLYDLEMNYHFKAANYFYRKRGSKNLSERNRSVKEIMYYFYGLPKDAQTALKFAKFFVMFEKPRLAEELLRPYFNVGDTTPGLIQYYLNVAYRHPDEFPNSDYVDEIILAKEFLTKDQWCNLFVGPCKISFQIFDDERIRNLYCTSCGDKKNFAHDEDAKFHYTIKVVK